MRVSGIVTATHSRKKISTTFADSYAGIALSFFAGAAITHLDFALEKCDYSTITMSMRVCYSQ
jgi:hypothetical protein